MSIVKSLVLEIATLNAYTHAENSIMVVRVEIARTRSRRCDRPHVVYRADADEIRPVQCRALR
jgi:hypothetical protein